ncbi:MAG: DUF6056 family protein [Gammaproteobacteria bacterium]|nr:DUF6056 family protein [Gammaproteobacteria bacterium]
MNSHLHLLSGFKNRLSIIEKKYNKLIFITRIAPCLLITSCLAVVLVFILLGQYSHPSSDDFCMASGVNNAGLFRHLWDHYFEWSGRYTGNALYGIYPAVFDLFSAYKFIPALLMLALFFAFGFLLSSVFRVSQFSWPILLFSLCFLCVFLLGMMSPASSLFWMAGAFTYQTANTLILVIVGLMIKLADRQNDNKNYGRLLTALLLAMAAAIGTNETSMLALTGLALFGVAARLRSGWTILKPWLAVFLLALLCFAVVYFSPGNTIRAADFPLRHDLTRSMDGSLSVGLKILWLWISNPLLIVSSLLAPFAISRLLQISDRHYTGRLLHVSRSVIVILILNTLLMPFVLQFPAWWSMGGWPPARTVDVIYFLFLISWFLAIGAITLRYLCVSKQGAATLPAGPAVTVAILLLSAAFAATALESKAYRLALTDLFHLARPYDDYLQARYKQIVETKARGQRYLVVPDYQQELPRSIFFNDIMHSPNHWRNVCYADYFDLEKIKRDIPR